MSEVSSDLEFRLNLLFRDSMRNDSKPEIVEWSSALRDRLRIIRYFQQMCLQVANEIPKAREREKQKVALVETGSLLFSAGAYLECFLYFITSMLDILAKLTREFYPRNQAAIGGRYFKATIKFFTETDRTLDREFTEILNKNKGWIQDVYDTRDTFAHSASSFIAFGKDGQASFERRKPAVVGLFRNKEFENLPEYLRATLTNILNFLESYLKHFRKSVPESETTRMFTGKP
jgi:hypothetical protein